MMAISALHNVSRSLGCALIAASSSYGEIYLGYFVGGEIALDLLFKVLQGDLFWYGRIQSPAFDAIVSVVERILVTIIAEFSGCFHMRHPVSQSQASD